MPVTPAMIPAAPDTPPPEAIPTARVGGTIGAAAPPPAVPRSGGAEPADAPAAGFDLDLHPFPVPVGEDAGMVWDTAPPPSAVTESGTESESGTASGTGCDTAAVAAGLCRVRAMVAAEAAAVGRDVAAVTLVAVSKTQPVARLAAAIAAGQRVFGENRVQEAKLKWPGLRARHPDLVLHLIGPLQTNKVREAVALFDVIQTLDRPRLAEALATEAVRRGHCPRCFVQVNTGDESQKAGVAPAEAPEFVRRCQTEYHLPVTGLMCIPPVDEEPALHFGFLADLARRIGLTELSMGMSADFPVAVRMGATVVRVGTAIFGTRHHPVP